jgi:hypothetical protein
MKTQISVSVTGVNLSIVDNSVAELRDCAHYMVEHDSIPKVVALMRGIQAANQLRHLESTVHNLLDTHSKAMEILAKNRQ